MNLEKNKVMLVGKELKSAIVRGVQLKQGNSFKYLGGMVSEDEVKWRYDGGSNPQLWRVRK